MGVDLATLEQWLGQPESADLEFKEARRGFNFNEVQRYLAALANEGGGNLVLGVSDGLPRQAVGTAAFPDHAERVHEWTRNLKLRIEATELTYQGNRVLVFNVGPRPRGEPVQVNGQYLMRAGTSLVPMTTDRLRSILDEGVLDASAEAIPAAQLDDLDADAIEAFRDHWANHLRRRGSRERADEIRGLTQLEVLERSSLVSDGTVTLAALVLLGSSKALSRLLAHHEIVYEYRSQATRITAEARVNIRQPFILAYQEAWRLVEARNSVIELPTGMLRTTIPSLREEVVREAIMNAVAHRDYQSPSSVFMRHDPEGISVESPGGLPAGVTVDTILDRQVPRNRLIAESLERCGLVERSGQGADIMFRDSIRDAKNPPSFEGTDEQRVVVRLSSIIQDPSLLAVMDRVSQEHQQVLDARDYVVLDSVLRRDTTPERLVHRVPRLVDLGLLERIGRGRIILSRRLQQQRGQPGVYSRQRGLERPAQIALIMQHLEQAGPRGARFAEFTDMFPGLSRNQIISLLQSLRRAGRITVRGQRRSGRWFIDG